MDPEIMSGVPVFTGTRVPVSALLEKLEAGVSLDEFVENFPTVSREQAVLFWNNLSRRSIRIRMRKPARQRGLNIQVESQALAHARASASNPVTRKS